MLMLSSRLRRPFCLASVGPPFFPRHALATSSTRDTTDLLQKPFGSMAHRFDVSLRGHHALKGSSWAVPMQHRTSCNCKRGSHVHNMVLQMGRHPQ